MYSHPIPISALYVALLGLLLLGLACLVIRQRVQHRVLFGEGNPDALSLKLAIRAHANAVEFVPITLLLLFFCELAGMQAMAVHAAGLSLLIARLLHAFGLSRRHGRSPGRAVGALVQFLLLLILPLWLLCRYAGVL